MALFATDMAAAVANKLGVGLELVPFKNPGLLADAANKDKWDVGLIGAEPARAAVIAFTAPYCEIEATYLVKPAALCRASMPSTNLASRCACLRAPLTIYGSPRI